MSSNKKENYNPIILSFDKQELPTVSMLAWWKKPKCLTGHFNWTHVCAGINPFTFLKATENFLQAFQIFTVNQLQTGSDLTACCPVSGSAVTSVLPCDAAAVPSEHQIWRCAASAGNKRNQVGEGYITKQHTSTPRLSFIPRFPPIQTLHPYWGIHSVIFI